MTQTFINTRQQAILVKIETTEGTDPVPTGVANALLCGNINPNPVTGSQADRNLAFPNFGATPKSQTNKGVSIQFDVECAGAGAAGTAPVYGALLRACGHSETITASTKVVYTPISNSFESVTIYYYKGTILHKLVGARGMVSFIFNDDGIPVMRFTMTGRWTAPGASTLPSCTFTQIDPLVVSKTNTPTFTLNGYAAVMTAFQLDQGGTVVGVDRPNAAYVGITNRVATGNTTFETPAVGTIDFVSLSVANPPTLWPAQLIHGITAGNIFEIDAPKVQCLTPTYGADGDISLMSLNLQFNRTVGDDEYTITVK